MTDAGEMVASYDYRLVVLSIVISVLGAYAALDLAERVKHSRGAAGRWLLGGAVASGMSTWAMHYVAMAAVTLPVPVLYHWPTVLVSYPPAALTAAIALFLVSRKQLGWPGAVIGSVLLGLGISLLHYTAMGAMRFRGMHHYSPPLLALSVLLPMLSCLLPLKMSFLSPSQATFPRLRKATSILFWGAANPAMHYTGMAAMTLVHSSHRPDLSQSVDISSVAAVAVSIVSVMALAVALLTSLSDRLRDQRVLLDELFEQAPQAVALADGEGRIVRINQEFSKLFGYSPNEVVGRRLEELFPPAQGKEAKQQPQSTAGRVELETVRKRKDGTSIQVSIVRVPIITSGPRTWVYEISRDITEQRRAHQMMQSYSQRLIETQEAERRRIARALHDEIGQTLTAIRIQLSAAQPSAPSAAAAHLKEGVELIDAALQQVRGLSLDLRPPLLDDLGLVAALRSHFNREGARAGLEVELSAEPSEIRVRSEVETACFRIVQEALTNVIRHADAQFVEVELELREGELHLRVRDEGKGFNPRAPMDPTHLGLLGMKERAFIVGGTVEVISAPGRGTEIHARFPLARPEAG
jgi:PAS domain S-box-containing protein